MVENPQNCLWNNTGYVVPAVQQELQLVLVRVFHNSRWLKGGWAKAFKANSGVFCSRVFCRSRKTNSSSSFVTGNDCSCIAFGQPLIWSFCGLFMLCIWITPFLIWTCLLPPEPMLSALLRRMPGLELAEIHQLVNCPESFTPDMRCLMGETPGISGYYVLAGMNSSGLAFAGGAGK